MLLSVLEQSVGVAGRPQAAAIRDSLETAVQCEALGYHRLWLSEHHSHPALAGTAPEILAAAIAMRTSRIRIGSAAVLLPHYAPLKVAEQFLVLEALAPGRIDLGVGRAPGGYGKVASAFNADPEATKKFPAQVADLLAWLNGEQRPGHEGVRACPVGPSVPPVWIMSSSKEGARVAAHFGLPYAFAHFLGAGAAAEESIVFYRDNFRPSATREKPFVALCVWALAADTDMDAKRLFLSRARAQLGPGVNGRIEPLQPPEVVAAQNFTIEQREAMSRHLAEAYVGTAPAVAKALGSLASSLDADELSIVTWTHDPTCARRSFALLAKAFELKADDQKKADAMLAPPVPKLDQMSSLNFSFRN